MSEVPVTHLFLKALNNTGVQFPSSKADIIKKLGDTTLNLSESKHIKAVDLVKNIQPDYFENGVSFLSAYHAGLYQDAKKMFIASR